ncbi:ThuA domain-containing protein [Luteolibacter sp. SL250]|uniref:PVC-type heme-binding CxxCH protein n=1 Tax=Luteolibacter sp. SL250 TaxID=2995170 RepID=UPI00226FBDD7|nr:PVC-type heme-binding CxxCH protein [Luteolibacter sp. SL250]WAC18557.1 ThuA domain-containing protein [Luteolibacter sp. SL250]
MKSAPFVAAVLALFSTGVSTAVEVKKVLFFSKSSGFEHSVIRHTDGKPSHVENVLAEIGKAHGIEFTCTKDGGIFTKEGLAPFDAVFFYTTGDLTKPGNDGQPPMPADGKQVLIDFISSGKGFIGTHSATDTFHSAGDRYTNNHECDPYICMLGGEFITHGSQQEATLTVASPAFPGMAAAGGGFRIMEEWYAMKNFAPDLHVLLVQQTADMTGNKKGNPYDRPPFPAAWARTQGKGRVYYTSLGHKPGTWTNPIFQGMLVGALNWTTGRVDADVTPNITKVTPGFATNGPPSKTTAEIEAGEDADGGMTETAPSGVAGLVVTASGHQGGARPNPPENAIDGKPETYWAAKGLEFPQWLQVDFGKPVKLGISRITWTSAKHRFHYRIEGSDDGKQWKMIFDGTANTRIKVMEDKLEGMARYLRVTLVGVADGIPGKVRPGISGWEFPGMVMPAKAKPATAVAKVSISPEKEKELLAETRIPDGYEATIFAAPPMINYPTFIATAPDGTVFVSCDKNGAGGRKPHQGRIVRLRDTDGDGRADKATDFVADIDTPRGLVWDHDRLYVMHPPHLSVFIDKDGDGVSDEHKILVKNIGWGFKDRSGDHASDGLEMGIDGWLYGSVGDFGFFQAEGADGKKVTLRGGGVIRVRPDGTGLEIHSRGTRNVYAVAVDPLLNVYGRDNNNDGSWGVLLHHFTGMDQRGYPSLFLNFPEDVLPPMADYVTGSGSGAFYLDEPGVPEKHRGLFTCDWGKSFVYHHPLTPSGATFKAGQEEFIGVPRTIDMKADASSNLYVASWRGAIFNYSGEDVGYIARVKRGGYQAQALPDFAEAGPRELLALLGSDSHRRRIEAQRALVRGGGAVRLAAPLAALAGNAKQPLAVRVAAVFALKQALGEESHSGLAALASDAEIRPFVIRALTDDLGKMKQVPVSTLLTALDDELPRTRLEAARALGRLGDLSQAGSIAARLIEKDPVVLHTVVRVLDELRADDACFAMLSRRDLQPSAHAAALRVVRGHHQPEVVGNVIGLLEKEKDTARRRDLLSALCRLHSRETEWKGNGWGLAPDTTGPYFLPEAWAETPRITAVLKQEVLAAKGDEAAFLIGELNRHQIHLEEAVASILKLAEDDARHIPAAVDMLARGTTVPEQGTPILVRAALDKKSSDDVRGDAVVALSRTTSAEGCLASLEVFADFEKKPRGERLRSRPFKRAKEAFFSSQALPSHTALLIRTALGSGDGTPAWADAALLKVSAGSAEARGHIDDSWKSPAGRVRILSAITVSMDRGAKDRVLSALADPDKAVATAAAVAAKALKLDPKATPSALIGTLKQEAVLRTMAKMKGDPELGEQLFTQQGCMACHTVNAGDALRAGPYLGGTAGVYRKDELAEMILNPSKSLAQGYEPHQITTKDGGVHLGFIETADKEKLVVRDMAMQRKDIRAGDVTENLALETSLMPPGLVDSLTEKELAALLAYLESLAAH